jgi:hypothetical protein
MQQPSSPAAPSTNQNVVAEQPVRLSPYPDYLGRNRNQIGMETHICNLG